MKKKEKLKEILLKEWNNIGTDVTEKLVDSVPNHSYKCVGILHDTELESHLLLFYFFMTCIE